MFYAGLACKHDEPVISGGVKTQVTFLMSEGPALTSYAVMPDGLLGGQVQSSLYTVAHNLLLFY